MDESKFDETTVAVPEGYVTQEQPREQVAAMAQPGFAEPDTVVIDPVTADRQGESSSRQEESSSMEEDPTGPNEPNPVSDEHDEDRQSFLDGMRNLLEEHGDQYRTLHRGDVLEGTIVSIDKDGILVDIGLKSEGTVPSHEAQHILNTPDEHLEVGSNVLVYVIHPENQSGQVVLSLNRARTEKGWRTVQKQFEEGRTIEAQVTEFNRGGLIVNISGVRGFVPVSQVVGLRHNGSNDSELEDRMKAMVGRHIQLKVIEVNRGRNRLILSERAATQEHRTQRKDQLLAELREGEIRRGRVSSVCDFGAFIDLGGADGLVHLSELSWSQVSHPGQVVKVGDEVDVYVIGVDQEKKKIALSLRRSQPGPWERISQKYKVGDIVVGTVTKLAAFGAFAKIEDGVEGLIHVSELGEGRIPHPKSVVKEGDEISLRIIRIDPERRRLGLSLKKGQEGYEPLAEEAQGATEPSSAIHDGPLEETSQFQGTPQNQGDDSLDGQSSD